MKIGMFTDTWKPTTDGVVNSILTTTSQLEKMGHEVYIFAPKDLSGKIKSEENTFFFRAMEFRSYPGYRVAMTFDTGMSKVRELGIEVLHAHTMAAMGVKAMIVSHKLRLPIATTFHTMVNEALDIYPTLPMPKMLLKYLLWVYLKQFLGRSEGVIAPTNAILGELKQTCPRMMQTAVIPTGVDISRFNLRIDGSGPRKRWGLEENDVILHVGRVAKEKNLEKLFDAIPHIRKEKPDAKLLVVGSGPAKDFYMKMVKEKGLSDAVIFTGFIPDEELPGYYACADCFAIASKFETQGLVVIEAMSCGKPVAGINYRAVPELIKDGWNGFLFEDDSSSCAEAIIKALDCGSDVKSNARQTAEGYSLEKCTERLVKFYEKIKETGAISRYY